LPLSQVNSEDEAVVVVTILLKHHLMSGEEKHLVSLDDRSADCLN
jgi:hypothetical protein